MAASMPAREDSRAEFRFDLRAVSSPSRVKMQVRGGRCTHLVSLGSLGSLASLASGVASGTASGVGSASSADIFHERWEIEEIRFANRQHSRGPGTDNIQYGIRTSGCPVHCTHRLDKDTHPRIHTCGWVRVVVFGTHAIGTTSGLCLEKLATSPPPRRQDWHSPRGDDASWMRRCSLERGHFPWRASARGEGGGGPFHPCPTFRACRILRYHDSTPLP